jgi:NAD+ synthase
MSELRDPASLRVQLVSWIREQLHAAGLKGAVFGLSGGIDSAVVCALATEALGAEHCLALALPIESQAEEAELAYQVADTFGVETITVDLTTAFIPLLTELGLYRERAARARETGIADIGIPATSPDALARANLKPRLRMISLYYYANLLGYMVIGTGNRDEFAVGYYTKHGDGGADIFPLGDLVKAEVRALAQTVGVPQAVIDRPPSAGLWPGQTDEHELGFTYAQLDSYLLYGTSHDASVDRVIARRMEAVKHKSSPAPVAQPH